MLDGMTILAESLRNTALGMDSMRDSLSLEDIKLHRGLMGKQLATAFVQLEIIKNQYGWSTSPTEFERMIDDVVNGMMPEEEFNQYEF